MFLTGEFYRVKATFLDCTFRFFFRDFQLILWKHGSKKKHYFLGTIPLTLCYTLRKFSRIKLYSLLRSTYNCVRLLSLVLERSVTCTKYVLSRIVHGIRGSTVDLTARARCEWLSKDKAVCCHHRKDTSGVSSLHLLHHRIDYCLYYLHSRYLNAVSTTEHLYLF